MTLSLVIVRPRHLADAMVEKLRDKGIDAHACPVIEYAAAQDAARIIADVNTRADAVIITSQQALSIAVEHGLTVEIPLFVTGARLAEIAVTHGFQHVHAADSNAASIVSRYNSILSRANHCVYLRANDVAQDLAALLRPYNVALHEKIIYYATPFETLPCQLQEAPEKTSFVCYSARHASVLSALLQKAQYGCYISESHVICISDTMQQQLAGLGWQRITVAAGTGLPDILNSMRG